MENKNKFLVFLTRLAFGWMFFYAGITKVLNPAWSAGGYLKSAKTFGGIYGWLGSAGNIGWVNFINEWGLTLAGVMLILGLGFRYAVYFLMGLMVLYYLPILNFPYVGEHSFLVDEHILYILSLGMLVYVNAGEIWGLDGKLKAKSY
jgi:thiosulfate dehydrogenase [quinone] large subunit